ncbi:hypothetical protein Lumi_068 [Xylophilus phage Lumi]|nr:hypothetical protein Lumi_068 [Xylophilus phage Lumi]
MKHIVISEDLLHGLLAFTNNFITDRTACDSDKAKHLVDELVKAKTTAQMPTFHIVGTRWFQRGPGNTYHKVRIYMDTLQGRTILYESNLVYGYDQQYLQTAIEWLLKRGYLRDWKDGSNITIYLREVMNSTWEVRDVQRKKDL